MTVPPLTGRSVVVTRSRAQVSGLADRLAALGARVVELPVIVIEDPEDGGAGLSAAAHRLTGGAYRWVVLTSANAASRLLVVLGDRPVPTSVSWAAVGDATARTLAEGGFPPVLVPGVSVSEALAEAFPSLDPRSHGSPVHGPDRTVLFPHAETVREVLGPGLRAKGWVVDEVVAYRTVAGHPDQASLDAARRADAIVFTSSSTVERTIEVLTAGGIPPIVASIGPVTSDSARASGLEVAVEADPHTIDGLVVALLNALGRPG